ncbi:unnamed protein product [Auanema sp. JU1783]|nr:unnamed protein product [Auanema sp. JU1783]
MNDRMVIDRINTAMNMIKSKYERDEGLQILDEVPMTVTQLNETRAGQKICRVFRSSRYFDRAKALHKKWIPIADKELMERWDELKHLWLSKSEIKELDRAQAKYDKTHNVNDMKSPIPITPGRQRHDSTDPNSSFTRDIDILSKENDRWFMDGVTLPAIPRTPRAREVDDSFDESFLDSESSNISDFQFGIPERRPRGRPRKNAALSGSRGRGSSRRGRRGRY